MFYDNAQILVESQKHGAISHLILYEAPAPDSPTQFSPLRFIFFLILHATHATAATAWAHQTNSLSGEMSSTISNLASASTSA